MGGLNGIGVGTGMKIGTGINTGIKIQMGINTGINSIGKKIIFIWILMIQMSIKKIKKICQTYSIHTSVISMR